MLATIELFDLFCCEYYLVYEVLSFIKLDKIVKCL